MIDCYSTTDEVSVDVEFSLHYPRACTHDGIVNDVDDKQNATESCFLKRAHKES